jgi:hypothetical protein
MFNMSAIKENWAMLTPSKKRTMMVVGLLVVAVIVIFGTSDGPIKPVITQDVENEIGVFEVADESVTLEALGTRIEAQDSQNDLLVERLKNTDRQLIKMTEMVQSLSGSDQNVRTLNELNTKMHRLSQMVEDVSQMQEIGVQRVVNPSVVTTVDDFSDDETTKEGTEEKVSDNSPLRKAPTTSSLVITNDSVSKTLIPDDPLAFIKSISKVEEVIPQSGNSFLTDDNTQTVSTPRTRRADIRIVTAEVSEGEAVLDNEEDDYVGQRVLAGSLIPIIVISGVDAPTGKSAEKGAMSSTLRVTGPIIGPNGDRIDLTGCLVTTSVKGDEGSERAYFRPNRMTCNFEYGQVDVTLKGYVTGKDGSQGFRGKLIKRDSLALLYGTVAGGVSGFAEAYSGGKGSGSQIIGINPADPYAMPGSDYVQKQTLSGAAKGGGKFLEDYYKNKLDLLTPIIEIKSLIRGSIHVQETFLLTLLGKIEAVKKKRKS